MTALETPAVERCAQCGAELAPRMKVCPVCARLVHTELLEKLSQTAREATDRSNFTAAMAAWREALEYLPQESRQHRIIAEKITELGKQIPFIPTTAKPADKTQGPIVRALAGLGALAMLAWKFKALALGLTKGTTLFTMLLSLGVYWTAWGWQFALGIVLSIYVHEMGHVFALNRYGFKATAPMFIPGLGALVRLQQQVVNAHEDAVIGLAGPIYGLGAALAAIGIWLATDNPLFAAIASVGAWINVFNLLPVASLDGGRGFRAMSRKQKLLAAICCGGAWLFAHDGIIMLVALVGFARALGDKSEGQNDWRATITYCVLVLALSAVTLAHVHTGLTN